MEPQSPPHTYEETIATMFASTRRTTEKSSWSDVCRLMSLFNDPQLSYRTIHVAGTNGKGSVSLKIASALQRHGYKTGLFISPHITDFCERIQVNSEKVSQDYVTETGQRIMGELRDRGISFHFFEITTVMGFLYFQREKVDFAVVEVGIGGLLDTTNVVLPEVSVVTSIGYDHMNLLGSTLEEIACQKAGIIKPNIPCVIGPNCPYPVFAQKCESTHSSLVQVMDVPGSTFEEENNRIAVESLRALQRRGIEISEESIGAVYLNRQPFRFQREVIETMDGRRVEIVMDVGHNSSAVSRFLSDVEKVFPRRPLHAIVGMSSNKDIRSTLQLIIQRAVKVHSFSVPHPRLLPHSDLHTIISQLSEDKAGVSGDQAIIDTVLGRLEDCDLVLICGSCFIMSTAYAALAAYRRL